jgi:AraC family carnitine catabolism transcriptional activator
MSANEAIESDRADEVREERAEAERLAFLLLPEFPIYALIPAVEALRIANQNSGRRLYDWQLLSIDGGPVEAGNGMSLSVDNGLAEVRWVPTVIVCAGNHPLQHVNRRVLDWLRRLARHGAALGAIDTGVFALARAGLLEGYRVTLHWEAAGMFRELYPQIAVTEQLFDIDRDRLTCAGGLAGLDLMLELVRRSHGLRLAQIVANGFVAQRLRRPEEPQRPESDWALAHSGSPLSSVLAVMKQNLAAPLKNRELAAAAKLSPRALHRLIQQHLGCSPMRYYRRLRLAAARNALFYSDLPIQDIAADCGFSSLSLFSRSFHERYGQSPREYRRKITREELRRFTPELDHRIGSERSSMQKPRYRGYTQP